jgi:hypothetical protein
VKDEGFLTAAGWRFVLAGAAVIVAGVLAYFLLSDEISLDIDLDQLTSSTTAETTTDFDAPEVSVPDITVPEVTVPDLADDPYFRCIERAETAQEIADCGNR